ncbi:MAG: hypothetical protein HYV97_04555 [Bdellovibrio sp.]|nr:hypothetical protein [Bdellovibrio sp.]
MNQRKSKSLLIDPRFQFTVIGLFASISLFACAILYTAVHYIFNQFVERGVELGLAKGHVFYQFIEWQKGKFDMAFYIVSLSVFLAITLSGLFLSHRIAGPLLRFKQYLQEEKDKPDVVPLTFRKGDFFSDLPDLFNKYQESKFGAKKDK